MCNASLFPSSQHGKLSLNNKETFFSIVSKNSLFFLRLQLTTNVVVVPFGITADIDCILVSIVIFVLSRSHFSIVIAGFIPTCTQSFPFSSVNFSVVLLASTAVMFLFKSEIPFSFKLKYFSTSYNSAFSRILLTSRFPAIKCTCS